MCTCYVGFEGKGKSLLLCATNRRTDLDAALLSRFNLVLTYPLPDPSARVAVIKRYAKQFDKDDTALSQMTYASEGLSCRDIKEACENVERAYASRLIRRQLATGTTTTQKDVTSSSGTGGVVGVPLAGEYVKAFRERLATVHKDNERVAVSMGETEAATVSAIVISVV